MAKTSPRPALLSALIACCACAGPRLPESRLAVVPARKEAPYSCGASAMRSVFRYWGVYDGPEPGLYERLGTRPREGTDPRRMAAAARELGLNAELKEDLTIEDLREALGLGRTVVLDLQAWGPRGTDYSKEWERGHYAVLVAADRDALYLADPNSGGFSRLPAADLAARWHDYEGEGASLWRNHGLGLIVWGARRASSAPPPAARSRPLP